MVVMVVSTEVGPHSDTPLARGCIVWCPGCLQPHRFRVALPDGTFTGGYVWSWDGNMDAPTFAPSMLCHRSVHLCADEHLIPCDGNCAHTGHRILDDGSLATAGPHTEDPAWGDCHSFLTGGVWNFLSDCAHPLSGHRVPMVDLPDWLI